MGGCCSDDRAKGDGPEPLSPAEKAAINSQKSAKSKEKSQQNKDLEAFDVANEAKDINALVKLMDSNEKTGFTQQQPHPERYL